MKAKFFKGAVSLLMSACLICSLLFCLVSLPISAESSKMLVWDEVPMYSRLHYRPNTGDFVAGAKYMYSFDFDNLTKTDEANLWGIFYRTTEVEDQNTFRRIPHANLDIKKSEIANGNHYDITFTVPDDCYEKENILFKYGDITSNGYIQTMRIGNLDLWKLDDKGEKTTQIPLSLPDSTGAISIVKTDNNLKYYGPYGKWMGIYAYMTGISLADQDGYFDPEIVNPFSVPENTLRFYKGAENTYAEYLDNSVNLAAGEYIFGCKYKTFGTSPDFEIYYSSDNGATYEKAETSIYDSKKFNRSVRFTLDKSANAVKIVAGNTGDRTDVSLAMAGVFLTRSDEEKQLISDLNASTVNIIGLSDAGAEKKWNVHTDAQNLAAVEVLEYDAAYFAAEPKAKTYQNVLGKNFSRIVYKDSSFVSEKNVEYMLTADFKVISGKFDADDVSNGSYLDPAFRVKVGNYYLENSKASYFTVLNSHFDELTGKLYIRFASKTKRTKLEITAGNYSTDSAEGVCAIGNVSVSECFTKENGVTVCKDNLISDINENSLCTVKNGDDIAENKWNVVYVSSSKEYKITDYSADYFKASPAMIEIKESAKGARISYTDNSLVLSAGKLYKFTVNMRTFSGNPGFSLAAKNIGGTVGDYSEIEDGVKFTSYFNEEFDNNTYLKTVAFIPTVDISDIRIIIGNIAADSSCGVAVANAQLYSVDDNGIPIGASLLSEMIKPNIKRNSTEQKVWNLNAADGGVEITVPVKENTFKLEKMVKIEPQYSYNRVEYYDEDFELLPNTTYRFTTDFMLYSGSPTFSLAFYDTAAKAYTNVQNFSNSYDNYFDKENNVRGIVFKTKSFTAEELSKIGDLRIMIGNSGESKDISIVFAKPQMYVIEDGKPVGENLVRPITDDTVLYMTTERSYKGFWDLRYQGAKGVAVKLLEIPENFFRSPVLAVKNGSGVISQTVTVKPDTNYRLSYYIKANAGKADPYIKAVLSDGKLADVTVSNEIIDGNGYYGYSCEFLTPGSLKESDNLRVGITFTNAFDGAAGNFRLYELNSGFDTVGGNIISNGDFTDSADITEYAGDVTKVWTYEGTLGDSGVSERASGYFRIPVSQMFIFVGGSPDNYISHNATLVPGNSYELSFNLKYANPGYEGETGVELVYKKGSVWRAFTAEENSPANEYKKCYSFTLPADADDSDNFSLKIFAASEYVSGYLANAVLTDTADKDINLFSNGDFSEGIVGWAVKSGFRNTYFANIPDGYFTNPQSNKPGMVVYRNAGSWENFEQIYLSLKPDAYYILVAKSVHPWQPNDTSVYSIQMSGKDDEGKGIAPFMGSSAIKKCAKCGKFISFTQYQSQKNQEGVHVITYECNSCNHTYSEEEYKKLEAKPLPQNTVNKIYHTIKNVDSGKNAHFRIVMQGGGNAGYWGEMALYECTVEGEIISDNILINSDFSLGITGWSISPTEKFNYRVVEQPKNFFENYKKNSGKMVVSNGTAKNATIGQSIEVERGKTYYFSGFYVNMNSAGVTPKVVYTATDGTTAVAPVEFLYDPDRFFFEGAFTLPDDAESMRGKATVQFLLDNGDKGKAYISDIGVYEEGKYENLFKNADFKNNFSQWQSNSNYTLSKYDESVFVFYYDDSAFDDGDWSGTATAPEIAGEIIGQILDGDGSGFANIRVILLPGRITARTDSDGYYRFKNLAPGEYSLYVRTPKGEELFVRTVTVESGMATGVSAITLSLAEDDELDDIEYNTDSLEYGIVCGYLFDSNGKPLKGQKLYLGDVGTVTTKAKGVFQFNDVPPGEYDIYTKLDDGSIHIFKRVKVVAGKGKIYKIKMPAKAEGGFLADLGWVWIVIIAAGGLLVLGGGALTVILILKKKKKNKS